MKTAGIGRRPSIRHERPHYLDWLSGLVRRAAVGRVDRERGPTVEQIVDHIMALECGEWCEVKLNPRITRVDNLKWLLPICVQQFGAKVDILEHTEGEYVVLTITVMATRRNKVSQPASDGWQVEVPAGELEEVA